MPYQTIIFDFDGVICHDRFYIDLIKTHPAVFDYIQHDLFEQNLELINDWMRAKVTTEEINKLISDHADISYEVLSSLFMESVNMMKEDKRLLKLARRLDKSGKKVALVTNNMDVFSKFTVKNHELNKFFPVIINSADYGLVKEDENGKLFDIAMNHLGVADYKNAVLIDNSDGPGEIFKNKGGEFFKFTNYEEFKPWIIGNLL